MCTTELGAFAKLEPEFTKRGVKLIGLSANTVESHEGWIKDVNEVGNTTLKFPIIADKQRKVAYLYDMLVFGLLATLQTRTAADVAKGWITKTPQMSILRVSLSPSAQSS